MANESTTKEWYRKPIFYIPVGLIILWIILSPSTILALYNLASILIPLLIVGVVIWGFFSLFKGTSKEEKAAETLKVKQPEIEFWNRLGATPEEREKSIKKLFDTNSASIPFGTRWDFTGKDGQGRTDRRCFVQFQISRSLATMEPREREFLKITFLLYNSGHLNENDWQHFRFALINGNGKASIDDFSFAAYRETTGIQDGPTAVKFYQDNDNASVDSVINELLKIIENLSEKNNALTKEFKNRIYGSDSWFHEDDIKDSIFNRQGEYQLTLGEFEGNNTLLNYSGDGSLITIAPPGSGKTQCFVFPNLLNWKGAAVVLDLKNEIYLATAKWRKDNIGEVYRFAPHDPNNSNSYNPLSFVRDDPDNVWEDSRFLADIMIIPSGASDPFWENMARDVLTAAIAYVTFNNNFADRAMSKVLDIIYGIGWDEMIISLKTNVLVASMKRMGYALGDIEKKQRDSILKTAQSSLSAWQGERITKITQKSDWNPLDLRASKPTIYICIKANEIDSYLSVIRVFIAQHIRILTTELPPRDSTPILFMLDELPRLKKMPPIDEALNIGRQYGIKLWMFAQSYGQLKDAYTDAEGLIGNCAVRTFMNLPLNDEFTTKISDQLGYRHDRLVNTKEKLVEPVELAGPNYRNYIIVLATGTKPVKIKKKFAYEDADYLSKMK